MMIYLLELSTGELVQRFDDDAQPGETIVSTTMLPRLMSPFERWNGGAIVDDLDALRAARWAMIRDARDKARDGTCATASGRVNSDSASRGLISGAAQMALLATQAQAPFSIDWTLADNTNVTLDAATMMAMGVAVGQHVSACHAIGQERRAALDAATSKIEIEAVPVNLGWPS